MARSAAEFWWGFKAPPHVHHYFKNHHNDQWQVVTWADIFQKRKQKQDANLFRKRFTTQVKPAYIWVFYNDTWLMGGWWVYIITLKKQWSINFRNSFNSDWQLDKIMNLYPCGTIPMRENLNTWAESFANQFAHAGLGRKKKQGIAKCYVEISGSDIKNIFIK